jgi:phosphonate transport system substrate-binding protein
MIKWISLLLLCYWGMMGNGWAEENSEITNSISLSKIVVALKPDKNPEKMLEEKKALSHFLSEELGRPVEVIIPLSSAVILEGLANGTIDLAYVGSTEMIQASDRGLASLLLAVELNGQTDYLSYWVTKKEAPYQNVKELKGKPIAFSSKTSTSGFVIPMWDLYQQGLISDKGDPETFFGRGNVWYGNGYVSAIQRVLSGEAEAAAVSYYVLDEDKHLTAEERAKLRKMDDQGPVPTHVLAIRNNIEWGDQQAIEKAFLRLNEDNFRALRDKLFTSKLVKVNAEKHLKNLRQALAFVMKTKQ